MKKVIKGLLASLLIMAGTSASAVDYNSVATAYVTTTISQIVVFDSTMQQGGTFEFSVLAHNGGGRAGQSDTANVKIEFYTSGNSLVTSANTSYSSNLPNPNAVCGNPCIDAAVPWTTLSISKTLTAAQAATVAYAKVYMYGIDGSYWAGDYGPWYRIPTLTLNGGSNLVYNPEFGPYNGITAQGWTTSPAFGACQGAWGGSNACIVNAAGVPGQSTAGLVANANGGGPSATGGTINGTPGGYTSTVSTSTMASTMNGGPTLVSTVTVNQTKNVIVGNQSQTITTPVTTKTYSDGSTVVTNGTATTTTNSTAAFTGVHFGASQVADTQWDVTACTTTSTCNIYSTLPGVTYNTQSPTTIGANQYITFIPNTGSDSASYPWLMILVNADGTYTSLGSCKIDVEGVDSNGYIYMFVQNASWNGTLLSANLGLTGQGMSFTGTMNPTMTQTNTDASNMSATPLAAGQTGGTIVPPGPQSINVASGNTSSNPAGTTTLDVTNSGTYTNNGTNGNVNNSGTFTNNGTTADVTNSGTFTNNGTTGTVDNSGTFTNNAGAVTGNVTNQASGTFSNSGTVGTVDNSGTFTNNSGGVTGNVVNNTGGQFDNSGTVGTVDNSGTFTNNAGGTTSTVTNSGTFTNNGTVSSVAGNTGTFTNGGTVTGDVTNNGTFGNTGTVSGTFNNAGILNNSGTLGTVGNSGTLNNLTGGTIATLNYNNSQVYNDGTINNITYNGGHITNNAGGTIGSITTTQSWGSFQNDGTVTGNVSTNGTFTNTGTVQGTYTNDGTLTNTGTVGIVTNNSTFTNSGTAGAVTNSGTFDNNGGTAGDVNNSGTFTNWVNSIVASLTNTGTATNNGTITGTVTNTSGTFTNTGTTGDWTNDATIVNSGMMGNGTNNSLFTNTGTVGTVNNTGIFANNTGGVTGDFTNSGTVGNAGTMASLTNTGTATNTGTITGSVTNTAGTFGNSGTTGDWNNAATLVNTGTMGNGVNSGTYTNTGTVGTVNNTGTFGMLSGTAGAITNSGIFAQNGGTISSINNTGVYDVTNTGNGITLGRYTQAAPGSTYMTGSQAFTVTGPAQLGGNLTILNAPTAIGKYTYMTANGVTGTYDSLTVTGANDRLHYTNNAVQLWVMPTTANVQPTVDSLAKSMGSMNTLANGNLTGGLGNDCSAFGANNGCVSVSYGNTKAASGDLNSAGITVSKAVDPHWRLGVFVSQQLNNPTMGNIKFNSDGPATGGFIGWNMNTDGTGLGVTVSATQGDGKYTIGGVDKTGVKAQAVQAKATYGIKLNDTTFVTPYLGVRDSNTTVNGYTETGPVFPLSYGSVKQSTTDVIAGVGVSKKLTDKVTGSVGVGVVQNVSNKVGTLNASSDMGNFSSQLPGGKYTSASASAGLSYELAPNQRIGVNVGFQDKTLSGHSVGSVGISYTLGF